MVVDVRSIRALAWSRTPPSKMGMQVGINLHKMFLNIRVPRGNCRTVKVHGHLALDERTIKGSTPVAILIFVLSSDFVVRPNELNSIG